jgi:hypothetical protein
MIIFFAVQAVYGFLQKVIPHYRTAQGGPGGQARSPPSKYVLSFYFEKTRFSPEQGK